MNLDKGTRLGPYEIDSRLGAGGMGEVYRARDVRLSRTVAIKVLPLEFASNASLKLRFDREAKAISSLNDSHICALYDVGHEDDISYLVLEYCEGSTLSDRLASGKLDLEQALRFGIDIASALEKAHSAGIIHRDVKPANLMITKSGVKVLDFGLAATRSELAPEPADNTVQRVTEQGQFVGTLTYTAPEVLRGQTADARSDVFALGLVLYEMITGRRAFDATDRATLIAEILDRQPVPVSEAAPSTPPALDRLIRSCLAKDPDQRVPSAHDVRLQLQWILDNPTSGATPMMSQSSWRPWSWLLIGGASVAILLAVIGWMIVRKNPISPASADGASRTTIDLREAPPIALGKFAPKIGYFSPLIALAHDGNLLVYVGIHEGRTRLFVRHMDRFEVEPLMGTDGAHHAFFSPDDRWIGFFVGDKVAKVAVTGGSPIVLAEVIEPIRGHWRGQEIYVTAALGVGLHKISENGGPAEKVGRTGPFLSDVLPGGRHALIRGVAKASGDFDRVMLLDLETGAKRMLIDRGYDARYVEPGFLIFARGGDLHLIRFDAARLETVGEAIVLQRNVAMDSFWGQAQYAVSSHGKLAFLPGGDRSIGKLAWVDRSGQTEFLKVDPGLYGVFSLSPNGRRIASEVAGLKNTIAIIDLDRAETRTLRIDGNVRRPRWLDDQHLVFSLADPEGSPFRIVSMDADGGRMRTLLSDSKAGFLHIATSDDGRTIVAHRTGVADDPEVHVVQAGDPNSSIILDGGGTSAISPDGRWIAYVSRRHGRQILVAPLSDPLNTRQVSVDGGGEPLWCRACPELFYRNGARWYAARVEIADTLRWDSPRLLWETEFIDTQGQSFDVSADGMRLLVSKRTGPDTTDRVGVVQDWPSLLPAAAR